MARPTGSFLLFAFLLALATPAAAQGRADEKPPTQTRRHGLAVATPAEADLPSEPLAKIRSRAKEEGSSALVILRDGKLVVEEYFGGKDRPLAAMSVTKSITALAIVHLAETGRLDLDKPLKEIFPEWDDGEFEPITVRHLLNHTSGLAADRANFMDGNSDIVKHAMESKRVVAPGTVFRYNNNAVDLLGAIVRPIAGMSTDEYLQAHIFGPMDIVEAHWLKDSAGNPRTAGELFIRPVDLAKLGQLILNEGKWGETQILKPETVRLLVAQSQPFKSSAGLLWWREQEHDLTLTREILDSWKQHGLPESAAASAKTLVGKPFSSVDEYRAALRNAFDWSGLKPFNDLLIAGKLQWFAEIPRRQLLGYVARGWLGQCLFVVPSCKLVAVRMRSPTPDDYRNPKGKRKFVYEDFRKDIIGMARSMKCLE